LAYIIRQNDGAAFKQGEHTKQVAITIFVILLQGQAKRPKKKKPNCIRSASANARGAGEHGGILPGVRGPTPDVHSAKAQERVSRSVTGKNEGQG
jgi:hypothetical protein